MISTIRTIGDYLNTFHECNNEELSLDFNYDKNVGMYFELNNFRNVEYKDIITLDIHFISSKKNKVKLLELLERVDKSTHKKSLSNFRIFRKDVYLIDAQDDKYEHFILSYNVNKY
ncbi:hypothetical protein QJR30_07630 [Paraclostridium sordellii]|uniref:hypothetical protein n=1 Tax=Paraclostridium sordellii TaxID=1505 RepID=UPI0030CE8416